MPTMLILRGKAGRYALNGVVKNWEKGALDELSAIAYAEKRGYVGKVLDVAGYASSKTDGPQVEAAMKEINGNNSITALYGFSAGGINMPKIIGKLTTEQRERLVLVVVIGAPEISVKSVTGKWATVYHTNPVIDGKVDHMAGPKALLEGHWDKTQELRTR
jgi:hypothetical protein